ncbi:translocation/assembly module TamB domain-containing protein [Staphylococcus epidermidis]|nr:translocation/assembly module TamB domain-containing protein [Staphylococcus epidermidis]
MSLQATANKLQVLVRADRQVSVSGALQAKLEQGQFTLRGDLAVDRASIILPEESALFGQGRRSALSRLAQGRRGRASACRA